MKISTKEQQRAEFLLQSQRIQLHQIESFSFMERYPRQAHKGVPAEKAKYGPGIFVFHLKEKQDKVIYMPPFRHPSSLVRFLVSQGVPFANYVPRERSVGTLPEETYRRPSLYMFWFFILFLMFLILGYYSVGIDAWWGFIPAILSFGLSLFFICMLMTRFCYLTLTTKISPYTVQAGQSAIRIQTCARSTSILPGSRLSPTSWNCSTRTTVTVFSTSAGFQGRS